VAEVRIIKGPERLPRASLTVSERLRRLPRALGERYTQGGIEAYTPGYTRVGIPRSVHREYQGGYTMECT